MAELGGFLWPTAAQNKPDDPLLMIAHQSKEEHANYPCQRIAFNSEVVDTSVQDLST